MSRWWAERIRIALQPDSIALVRLGRGRRPRVTEKLAIVVPQSTAGGWQPLAEALASTLKLPPWQGAQVEVVLSHHLCRLAVLPGGLALRSREEESRYARMRIAEVNGEDSATWDVTLADDSPALPRIACAVDSELLRALDMAVGRRRLASVQPLLAAAYNSRQPMLGQGAAWFVTVEPARACIARVEQGIWRSLRVRRIFSSPAAELAALLDQERLLGEGELPDRVVLCAPQLPGLRLPAGSRWRGEVRNAPDMPGFTASADSAVAMALEGLA